MDITDLLVLTRDRGASDLHLVSGIPPSLRIHGNLVRLEGDALTREDVHTMLYDVLTDDQKARFEAAHDLDFSLEFSAVGRYRGNALMQRLGAGMVLRMIPSQIRSLDDLGMPAVLKQL